jgi:hypothetical protein
MTWQDFLKYSKYIAVFYGLAFCFVFAGIWVGNINMKLIWSGGLCFAVALAANVALGSYHYNHKKAMAFEKNVWLDQQQEAQVITGETPKAALQLHRRQNEQDFQEVIDQAVNKTLREKGYR